jgi:hydrogenase maturation protein HypF
MNGEIRRVRLLFTGIVQGVGFRPTIYRRAVEHDLAGFVCNTPEGVVVEVEGIPRQIELFLTVVLNNLPPASEINAVSREELSARGDQTFRIIFSRAEGDKDVFISPDLAVCEICLKELRDPLDRRYRYPFLNCPDCGPRLTIIRDVPYDRENTAMACFPLCPECRSEYENPIDRRFHAEPNACAVCGSKLWITNEKGTPLSDEASDPVTKAIELLRQGKILAIKGLGGFHLAVDATNEEAVSRLRTRKYREEKPLAIMVKDLDAARKIAEINAREEKVLTSQQCPIVLCRKRKKTVIASTVAPGVPDQGIMLPYTPLHHLLLEKYFAALVMTSANQVEEPICKENREALFRLKGIADNFLLHNRDILVRCDDSVAMVVKSNTVMIRRSRGYAPKPLLLQGQYPEVLALGPHLKATLCILKRNLAYISPHIGDLETPEARKFHSESRLLMERISQCRPDVIACDLHPAYYTTRLAEELPHQTVIRVQHHHAHIVSAMAENGLTGKVIGLAMDGTGYGTDGTAWGCEFLVADEVDFQRAGHLQPYPLPGSDKAVREPWRVAMSLLRESFGSDWQDIAQGVGMKEHSLHFDLLDSIMASGLNSPLSSSLGRVFDAVAAILGIRQAVSFEGQAAMELEAMANIPAERTYPFLIRPEEDSAVLDFRPLIRSLAHDRINCKEPAKIAASFHSTIINALAAMADVIRERTGLDKAVLSGGCFQNRILLDGVTRELGKSGFTVYIHRNLPPNDGCIALGQAIVAAASLQKTTSEGLIQH